MPLDLMLLSQTQQQRRMGYDRLVSDWMHQSSELGCRRVSSFPMAKGHHPLASGMKVRSQSESEALHRVPAMTSLDDLKRELASIKNTVVHEHVDEDEDEDDDSDASSGVSSVGVPSPPPSPKQSMERPKKRVMFADDCGLELTTVKVMTEPSDVPPRLSPSVFRALLGDAFDEEVKPSASWIVDFTQPASEYVKFRETLERQNVALENVLVRNDQCKMVGTIKVKNIDFEKNVIVRFTDNNWQSYFDRPAVFQRTAATSNVYDTFCFDIDIPCDDATHNRIDFCVCFRTTNGEYWDSNGGSNYSLVSPSLHQQLEQTRSQKPHAQLFGTSPTTAKDAYILDYDNWTKFASWKNLSTDTPYW